MSKFLKKHLLSKKQSLLRSVAEVLMSLVYLNIIALVSGIVYFLNPFIIVKTVEKVCGGNAK